MKEKTITWENKRINDAGKQSQSIEGGSHPGCCGK